MVERRVDEEVSTFKQRRGGNDNSIARRASTSESVDHPEGDVHTLRRTRRVSSIYEGGQC